jgi:hypothetical protein
MINISLDYTVGSNPYSSHPGIMKMIILHLGAANKPSLIFESVAEI